VLPRHVYLLTHAFTLTVSAVAPADDTLSPLQRPDRSMTVNSESGGFSTPSGNSSTHGLPGALAVVQLLEVRTIDRLHSPYTVSAHLRSKEH
jgi:hypothetical protein